MNVADNLLLQQMQSMANLPKTGNNGGGKDQAGSFQDMMDQAGQDTAVNTSKDSPSADQSKQPKQDEKTDSTQSDDKAPVQSKDGQKTEETEIDPNVAVYVMDLFRPEIVEVQPEAVVEVPVELVETAAPVEEAPVEVPVMEMEAPAVQEEEAPAAEAPVEAREAVTEEAPEVIVETEKPVETERPAEAPQEAGTAVVEEKTTDTGELKEAAPAKETEEPQNEAVELPAYVFHEVKAAPVKVAENYEPVDTEAPDMDGQLANQILNAAQNGVERMQIQLTPANLGQITIDLTRNTEGALEVVIHASTGKAAGLLNQHLDGLNAALQNYGNHQTVHVEVQRSQEGQEQHMFQHADPDGRGQQQHQQQEERKESESSGEDFLQKLRLGLTGLEE